MNIRFSSIASADRIFNIFKDCRKSMKIEDIFQWTESYPNFDVIANNIINKELYELHNEDEILGVICLNVYQEPQYETIDWLDKSGNALIIHRLAVSPLFQNKGFAKKLMAYAEEYALKTGFNSIRLDAFSGNEKALRLYEGLDYKKRGKVNFPGRNLPFICYEKILK